jgi:transposase
MGNVRLPFPPSRASVGRPRIDDRLIVNGILYVLVTGCRWMDLPAKYGSYKTAGIGLGSRVLWVYGLKSLKPR